MSKIVLKKRHSIRKSQVQDIFNRLAGQIGADAAAHFRDERMEIVETNGDLVFYLINRKPLLMQSGGVLFPTLKGLLEFPFQARRVVVDAGAVPYVVNGADVMRPGIVGIADDVVKGEPVQIVEERHGKAIAVGIAQYDAVGMREKEQGKVIKNIHYVGDDIWNTEF